MTTPSAQSTGPLFGALFREEGGVTVRVALPVPVDTLFSYRVPATLADDAQPGHRVLVPFSGPNPEELLVLVPAQSPPGGGDPVADRSL